MLVAALSSLMLALLSVPVRAHLDTESAYSSEINEFCYEPGIVCGPDRRVRRSLVKDHENSFDDLQMGESEQKHQNERKLHHCSNPENDTPQYDLLSQPNLIEATVKSGDETALYRFSGEEGCTYKFSSCGLTTESISFSIWTRSSGNYNEETCAFQNCGNAAKLDFTIPDKSKTYYFKPGTYIVSNIAYNFTWSLDGDECPSKEPSISMSPSYSQIPTDEPSISAFPSGAPSGLPSTHPSISSSPSHVPTMLPSLNPSTSTSPSSFPTDQPSQTPSTSIMPSISPTGQPSQTPSTSITPSMSPTSVCPYYSARVELAYNDYKGNGNVCSSQRYMCSNNFPGKWNNGRRSFTDPVPEGYIVTHVVADLPGRFGCDGNRAKITAELGGYELWSASATPTSNCKSGCTHGYIERSEPNVDGLEGYNYNGTNIWEMVVASGEICVSGMELYLCYQEPPAPSYSSSPSTIPSVTPTLSSLPSNEPSVSKSPSKTPSNKPSSSNTPSMKPSYIPSSAPSSLPSVSNSPSKSPSDDPSSFPTHQPSYSALPSEYPSGSPTQMSVDFCNEPINPKYTECGLTKHEEQKIAVCTATTSTKKSSKDDGHQ